MQPRLVPSIAAQALGAGVNTLISLALVLFLARQLGAAEFGDYVALLSLAVLLLIVIEGGWPTLVYRESVPADGGIDPPGAARLARSAAGHVLASGLGLITVALLLGSPGLAGAVLCMTLTAGMNLVSARLRGAGRFLQEARWQILGRVASAVAIVAAVLWLGASPGLVFLGWAAGLALTLLLGGRGWLGRPAWRDLRSHYGLALPFIALEGMHAFLFKGDVALLRWLGLPGVELSQYAACTRLTEAGLLLFAPLTNVLLRTLRQRAMDAAAFAALTRRAMLLAMAAGLCAWLGSVALGARVMPSLFGVEFTAAGALLPWVSLMLVFGLPNLVCFQALIARGRERWLAVAMGGGVLALAVGLAAGSEWGGAQGAAQGVVASQALLLLACLAGLRRRTAPAP